MTKYFLFISFLITGIVSASAQQTMLSWSKINQINLNDLNNKPTRIPTGKPTVFIMLSPECPLCKNYAPVLNDLQKNYPDVNFYGIYPGKSYTSEELTKFRKEYRVSIPMLMDPQKKLSSYLKATTTPESIYINEAGIIAYRGLIDNWASSLGQKRKIVTEKYLADALDQTIAKKPVARPYTKPIGCLINDL